MEEKIRMDANNVLKGNNWSNPSKKETSYFIPNKTGLIRDETAKCTHKIDIDTGEILDTMFDASELEAAFLGEKTLYRYKKSELEAICRNHELNLSVFRDLFINSVFVRTGVYGVERRFFSGAFDAMRKDDTLRLKRYLDAFIECLNYWHLPHSVKIGKATDFIALSKEMQGIELEKNEWVREVISRFAPSKPVKSISAAASAIVEIAISQGYLVKHGDVHKIKDC